MTRPERMSAFFPLTGDDNHSSQTNDDVHVVDEALASAAKKKHSWNYKLVMQTQFKNRETKDVEIRKVYSFVNDDNKQDHLLLQALVAYTLFKTTYGQK